MQSKGAIKFFAIVFALVCLYQLSFTWFAKNVENEAKEFAQGDPVKEKNFLDSMAAEPVYNILVKNYTYREVKEREINLGLDLQGGMNVTLEVSLIDLIRSMANHSVDANFNAAINKAIEDQKKSQEDFVTLFGKAFNSIDPNGKLSAPTIFGNREMTGKVTPYESTNEEVLEIISNEAEGAVDRTLKILRTRIDKFGVSSPNIQRIGTSGRIFVELPGVKEKDRVRKLLQGTAKLEFLETFDNVEIYPYLTEANDLLKSLNADTLVKEPESVEGGETLALSKTDTIKETLLEKLGEDTAKASLSDKENLEKFLKENPLFSVIRPVDFKGPVVGTSAIKDTAKVNAYLEMKSIKALFPFRVKFLWTSKPFDDDKKFVQLIAIKVGSREGAAPLEGDAVSDARQEFNQVSGHAEISMSMNAEGAKKWRELTKKNIGKSIAIVLDDNVYSFPTVQGEIAGGNSSITGNFEINEAKDLANILKAGKLPAPAKIVEEAVVGPSLGEESINAGFTSFGLALVLVLIFMVVWYNNAGLVANIALLVNLFFIMGVLASINAVLTLPGIAGIVLTIGMSVDANVLIFERIREEITSGKGLKLAIEDGYKNAYSSIIDSNVTSLLTGIILYVFGTGPIKGFATTLVIGILTSLFAAIFISRLIFIARLEKNKVINFSTKYSNNAFKNISFDWIGKRKVFYTISSIIIIVGLISFASRGFNLGVDFTGGHSFVVRFDNDVKTVDVRAALVKSFGEAPEVKTFGENNQVKVTTQYLIDDTSENVDEMVEEKLSEGLQGFSGGQFEIMSSQKVGPTVADDIKASAVWAVLFSLLVIFMYIVIRFNKWQFGLGALAALFHDVIIVLSVFSMFYGVLPFSLEIDTAFIAAILTVIGYSINDTVVVFDRIREFIAEGRKKDFKLTINNALNNTISRTLITSLTTIVVLLTIFIFGGEVIRGFLFAMLIGIVVGTYSSLCIATPLMVDFTKVENAEKKEKEQINM